MDWLALKLSLQLALATTAILFFCGLPLAYWLANSTWRGKYLVEAIVALPLVLPPTVLGFYLLVATGPHSPLGQVWSWGTGGTLPFTFGGILLGSVICNTPLAVRPFLASFAAMDRQLVEASWCLGASKWETFWRITLPVCWPGILTGMVMTFAHAIGEFGIVLMIGGSIPGVTRTLSIAIYDDVQALNYAAAARSSFLLLGISLAVLTAVQNWGRRSWPR